MLYTVLAHVNWAASLRCHMSLRGGQHEPLRYALHVHGTEMEPFIATAVNMFDADCHGLPPCSMLHHPPSHVNYLQPALANKDHDCGVV